MRTVSLLAPAKLNLFLAITGRRPDGFHDLVSLVVQLDFGDRLTCTISPARAGLELTLACNDPEVPTDESNLVLKAARAFAAKTGWTGAARFTLEKRIPMGAGLGGGSSDAVAALRAMNELCGAPLDAAPLREMAAQLGSDCPLFLCQDPVVLRGRGERVEPLPETAVLRLRGRRVVVFKPAFGVPTPWAYAQLAAAAPAGYLSAAEAERRLAEWLATPDAPAEALLFNNMEPPVGAKFIALPVMLEALRHEFGLNARMSGSGSACFAFVPEDRAVATLFAAIRARWGDSAFVIEGRIA